MELISIDGLTLECGHHYASRTNNGYGCRHPDVRSRDGLTGEGQCFTFSCPLADAVYPSSEPEDRRWLDELGFDHSGLTDEGGWMVTHGRGRKIVRLPVISGG